MYLGFDDVENTIVMVFRGTHNNRNWITNFDGLKEEYPHCKDCKVHQGFYNLWNSFESEVMTTLR